MAKTPTSDSKRRRGKQLAALLKNAREESGRSREDVARNAGISLETIKHIEEKRSLSPTFFTVIDLARELRLKLKELDEETR